MKKQTFFNVFLLFSEVLNQVIKNSNEIDFVFRSFLLIKFVENLYVFFLLDNF